MANRPLECNPSLHYSIACNSQGCSFTPEPSTGYDQLEFVLNETIKMGSETICRYFVETPACNFSADYLYNKNCLMDVTFQKHGGQ